MFNNPFFNDTLRKYTALFGTLFNSVYVIKNDGTTNGVEQRIKVPVAYSPKDKLSERVKVDPDLDRPTKNQLPRMGFEMVSLDYDRSRKLTTTIRLSNTSNGTTSNVYMPVPYNVNYKLYILVKSQTDGTRIVEQILPFFTPDWTPTVELIPDIGLKYDIPIILNSIDVDDTYEGGFDDSRIITWTLDFTLKGYLFGPVTSTNSVIKFANVNIYTATSEINPPVDQRITVQPGIDIYGNPTEDITKTIPYSQIDADDNYGYIVQTIFNP